MNYINYYDENLCKELDLIEDIPDKQVFLNELREMSEVFMIFNDEKNYNSDILKNNFSNSPFYEKYILEFI